MGDNIANAWRFLGFPCATRAGTLIMYQIDTKEHDELPYPDQGDIEFYL